MRNIKKKLVTRIGILTIVWLVLFTLISCGAGGRDAKQEARIKELYTQAQAASGDQKIEATAEYLQAIVIYQQAIQEKNPNNLDIDLLDEGTAWAEAVYNEIQKSKQEIGVVTNHGTLVLLKGAYYVSEGEIADSVESVTEGVEIFDDLVDMYPANSIVRGYRAVNFSNLPELFGKTEITDEDFSFVLDYIEQNNTFSVVEKGFYPVLLARAHIFYTRQKKDDVLAKIEVLSQKFSKE